MTEDQIRASLEELGAALSQGDAEAVAAHWEVPALVLGDQASRPVATLGEVRQFFAQAIAAYRKNGEVATRPYVERVTELSPGLAAVDVTWTSLDAEGREKGWERSHYVMHQGQDGKPRIQVATSRVA